MERLPAADGIFTAGLDPSSDPTYYDRLLHELDASPVVRVEIPFTLHHWEATYVASQVPLARGWERQLDRDVNPLFYDGELSPSVYQRWLADNAISYVALPDAALDESARAEADLLRAGMPELEPVWHDADWQLWKVRSAAPLVEGPARLVRDGCGLVHARGRSPRRCDGAHPLQLALGCRRPRLRRSDHRRLDVHPVPNAGAWPCPPSGVARDAVRT